MSTYATAAAAAGEQYLQSLAQGQERFIEYVRASREYMPPMMEARVAAMPSGLPTMQELADVQFRFATRLLDQQQKFYRQLYGAPQGRTASKAASSGTTAKSTRSSTTARASGRTARKRKSAR